MLNTPLIGEFKHEASSTKRMLERVPAEKFDWKPHEKSMTLGRLAAHVAEIPGLMTAALTTEELDFAKGQYPRITPTTLEELMQKYQQTYDKAIETLTAASDESLLQSWTLRRGDHVIFTNPRIAAIRSLVMNHFIHHRGQLSVYLRLLNVPLPGIYGPSADEQ